MIMKSYLKDTTIEKLKLKLFFPPYFLMAYFSLILFTIFLASLSLDSNQANAIRSKVEAPYQNWDHINDYEKLFKSYNY